MATPHLRVNRKLTRIDLDKRVRVTLHEEPAPSAVLHGRTYDISEGGMCAIISGHLKPGSLVCLEVSGLEEGSLGLTATVRHAKGFYYGFEFVHMDQKQFNALVKMITRNGRPKKHSGHVEPSSSPAQP
ncbi:MAG TPA: PilZ domain-containing protein [Candidatus Koribacter sp.]|jgi:c-di-GMP-binding flagellar brake protein YcgR